LSYLPSRASEIGRRFCRPFLHDLETTDAARQLTRASAAAASNYRAVCLARSRPEFVAKLGVVLEEADECHFWTEYLRHGGIIAPELDALVQEAGELTRLAEYLRRSEQRIGGRQQPEQPLRVIGGQMIDDVGHLGRRLH
jgi:four helix bundle protein